MTGQTHRPHLRFGDEQAPDATTPYARYVHLAELHSLQQPRSEVPSEYTFIVATQVMEHGFGSLKRSVRRVCSRNVPVPFAPVMEGYVIAGAAEIVKAVKELL
jgi:hypothetical protein